MTPYTINSRIRVILIFAIPYLALLLLIAYSDGFIIPYLKHRLIVIPFSVLALTQLNSTWHHIAKGSPLAAVYISSFLLLVFVIIFPIICVFSMAIGPISSK